MLGGLLVATSCASSHSGELEPRYIAVHNAFASVGLTQVGPLYQGSLGEGKEARVTFDLTAQCVTLMAIGGDGVHDVDVTLLDPTGKSVAHDTTREPQAVLRVCLETAGSYTLVVKMASGSGNFVAATWAGGLAPPSSVTPTATSIASVAQAAGTCEAPLMLAAGTVTGATTRGESEHEGSCGKSNSKELIYKLELRDRQRVSLEVNARFDSILYVRKDECAEAANEVACNDDAPDQTKSKLDLVLDAGAYFVFVDGYNGENGTYRLTTSLTDVPPLAEVCRRARQLVSGATQAGTTAGTFDNVKATCGDNAKGLDIPYKLDIPQRSRVRLTEQSTEFPPVVHMRRSCADEQSEVACSDAGMTAGSEASYVGLHDPGSYAVWADSKDHDKSGAFTLVAEVVQESGTGAPGDGCGDAQPLHATDHSVSGDTFLARDDISGKCGGGGAPDVFYRVDLAKRSRVTARFEKEEGHHTFILSKACADRTAELQCAPRLDEVLPAGTYFLAVDGQSPEAFGKYTFEWRVRDIGGQESACRAPQAIADGQTMTATTKGDADHFTTSCAGREDTQGSPDRMYKIVVAARSRIRLSLTTPTWDGVLALRKSCLDIGATVRTAEIDCNNDHEDAHHSRIERMVDAGTYYVLVDGHATGNEGPFTLEYKVLR